MFLITIVAAVYVFVFILNIHAILYEMSRYLCEYLNWYRHYNNDVNLYLGEYYLRIATYSYTCTYPLIARLIVLGNYHLVNIVRHIINIIRLIIFIVNIVLLLTIGCLFITEKRQAGEYYKC